MRSKKYDSLGKNDGAKKTDSGSGAGGASKRSASAASDEKSVERAKRQRARAALKSQRAADRRQKKADRVQMKALNAAAGIKTMSRGKRILRNILLVLLALIIIMAVYVIYCIISTPDIQTDDIYGLLQQNSIVYDASGTKVDSIYSGENREIVAYDDLPKNLVNAFIAIEDKTFWKHHGFNIIRIFGAMKEAIFSGGDVSGTSTITQQLARNVYLADRKSERTMKRKIQEAWITVILENRLTKKQIIEAYLNTISLGFNTNGVKAASQAYFSKDPKDLTLSQCAMLAALPAAPSSYAPVMILSNGSTATGKYTVLNRTSVGTYVINETAKGRRDLVLQLMNEQGYITKEERDEAQAVELSDMLDPDYTYGMTKSSYFKDYLVDTVIKDLRKKYKYSYKEAWDLVYHGGLNIYSTMDSQAQSSIESVFSNNSNFPVPTGIRYDSSRNILNKTGGIMLYSYSNIFDSSGNFTFSSSEASKQSDGSIVIRHGQRLNIYRTEVNGTTDYSIEFPSMYRWKDNRLYVTSGGYINIPQKAKKLDANGDIVVSAKFVNSKAGKAFFSSDSSGQIVLPSTSYTLNQETVQPQAAMTIVENSTGQIKAMVGGRNAQGGLLYNRAISTRQPGSSIKPLAVYSAALQQSAEEAAAGEKHTFTDTGHDKQGTKFWGDYITAGSVVLDEQMTFNGKSWPRNSNYRYSGMNTLRTALKNSINTCAVKIFLQVGSSYSIKMLKKYGITTVVTSGAVSDVNPAALALGGMTKGVTTLEMANAYTVFPNNGTRAKKTICYTKVTDRNGKTLLENKSTSKIRVLNEDVAWIMKDLLQGVVQGGTGTSAYISGVSVGGKTGTTSDQYDIWFDGFTPSYSAALWVGNDVNIRLTGYGSYAASIWSKIMRNIPNALKGSYPAMPSTVQRVGGEYYAAGTYSSNGYAAYLAQKKKEEEEKKKAEEEAAKAKAEQEAAESDSDTGAAAGTTTTP